MPYDPTIYQGAAAHYRCGRPPYSPQLEAALCEEAGLDGLGRLLDVGCGPGVLAVRLAGLFEAVVGLDPDADMLTEGRRRTHRFEDVLVLTRFGEPQVQFLPRVADLVRDSESVLSGYFSFAPSAPHLFPDGGKPFAQDMRALLADRSPHGAFWDWPGDTEVVLARKDP